MFDVIIYLNPEGVITRIEWKNDQLEKNFGVIWSIYIGEVFSNVTAFTLDTDLDRIHWNDEDFLFYQFDLPDGNQAMFMKRDDHMEYFLKAALDTFPESIQIYDRNAMAVHFNKAGLASIDFPHKEVQNKHVLELYEVEADYSTVLTALRTQNRIVNRFARYRSRSGVDLTAVNNAWPVFFGGKLLGIVDTEMTMGMVKNKIRELKEIENALEECRLQDDFARQQTLEDIPAESPVMQEVIRHASEAAAKEENILITGAHGTGKDVFANCIHSSGLRSDREMLVMNCAAIPEDMQEQMLRGVASDDPAKNETGLLEKANGGTLLLQDVSSLSLRSQSLLMKVLQNGYFQRIGGTENIAANVQIISTTSKDIPALVESKHFRIDLYYRLSVFTIAIPSLAERTPDFAELIASRIRHNESLGIFASRFSGITPDALECMKRYSWPGNLKELNYAVDFAMSMGTGPEIQRKDLPSFLTETAGEYANGSLGGDAVYDGSVHGSSPAGNALHGGLPFGSSGSASPQDFVPGDLKDAVGSFEQDYIQKTLQHFGGNISKSAAALGLKRQSLQYRLKKQEK